MIHGISVLQCVVAVWCSVLQCRVAARCSVLQYVNQRFAVCMCVVVCCSMVQRVAVCRSATSVH